MRRYLQQHTSYLLSFSEWRIRLALWGGAVLVGLAATLFAVASEKANGVFQRIIAVSPWLALVVAPAGMTLAVWLTRRFFPGSQGSGIPQALAACEAGTTTALRDQILSLRIAIGKIVLAVLGLCSGASIGREGPTVHIGAAIMYNMGKLMRFPPHYMERALVLAGGAAGISAAFNTPLAGIVFAIEEISRSFEEKTNGIVLVAVIFAGVVAIMVLGNYNYFGITTANLSNLHDWVVIPFCGIVGGLVGGLFSQILIHGSRHLAPIYRRYPLWVAAACGLSVALIGLLSGSQTYGTGYAEAKGIITSTGEVGTFYPALKILATIASYLSGIPGGIFAPSLAAGAGFGSNLAAWFPAVPAEAIIILGMAGYFTGVVQTPITAFVIIIEMTSNQSMLLPLMAVAFIAHGTSRLVCPEPIYRALAQEFLAGQNGTVAPPPAEPATPPTDAAPDTPTDNQRSS